MISQMISIMMPEGATLSLSVTSYIHSHSPTSHSPHACVHADTHPHAAIHPHANTHPHEECRHNAIAPTRVQHNTQTTIMCNLISVKTGNWSATHQYQYYYVLDCLSPSLKSESRDNVRHLIKIRHFLKYSRKYCC